MRYKNPLTALVLAGVAAGFSTSANAVNLDAPAGTTAEYASELTISPAGTALAGGAGNLDVTTKVGFGITALDNHSFRWDIAPAIFTVNPTMVGPLGSIINLSSGGVGADFVIFDITAGAGGIGQNDLVGLGISSATVADQGSVTVVFGNYQDATLAANQDSPLYENSGQLLTFTNALTVEKDVVFPLNIDVGTNSTEFVFGNDTTIIGKVTASIEGGVLWSDGAQTQTPDLLSATPNAHTVVVTGDFSAAQDLDAGVPDGNFTGANGDVFADPDFDGTCDNPAVSASAAAFDGATANLVVPGIVDPANFTWDICYTTNGVSEIADGPVNGTYDVTAAAGASTGDTDLGVLSILEKNGDSEFANFVLTPQSEGGVFRNWGRVCNNSSIDGRVFVRLTNDLGDTVAFELGDVAGQVTELGANECTAQILVDDFYAAGQATDPTFSVGTGGRNKLRALFEGEFPAIDVDNITVSRDNNTFNTFQ
jgi:hypothetical protein